MTDETGMSEEWQLIQQATGGDVKAYGILYERHLDAIYRYIYFRIGNEHEAEDLSEEVFIKAWEAMPDFEPGSERSFYTWLYRIAHNLVIDFHRKKRPQSWSSEQLALEETRLPSVEDAAHHRSNSARLAHAIQQLNDVEQQVIILRFVEGLSHKEIAGVIDKSEGASRIIQHRALSNLRTILLENQTEESLRDE
jgi:RNA polymerase sigma-70 factor (ECF subfamily)